jgi:hypothetical protein
METYFGTRLLHFGLFGALFRGGLVLFLYWPKSHSEEKREAKSNPPLNKKSWGPFDEGL